jgi:hypothetical protein
VAVEQDADPPFDFWPYVDTIPTEDSNGHDFSAGAVTHAWTMPISNYQHVLVRCETPNVFSVRRTATAPGASGPRYGHLRLRVEPRRGGRLRGRTDRTATARPPLVTGCISAVPPWLSSPGICHANEELK